MKVTPVASDSLGTRSMATFVETKDLKLIIDPGVALGPSRYGLAPHPLEVKKLDEDWEKIVEYAREADVVVVTHYHYDHHNPHERLTEVYRGKVVLVKHPTEKINFSQAGRAAYFLEQIRGLPQRVEECDGKEFVFGRTRLRFSAPVFHGESPRLGFVVEVLVEDLSEKIRFLHTSDVVGLTQRNQVEFIVRCRPDILYLDGPLTYMMGYRYSTKHLEASLSSIKKVIEVCRLEALIVDHHFLRDESWRVRLKPLHKVEAAGRLRIQTAAEFLGKEVNTLEAWRRELYRRYPASEGKSGRLLARN